MKILRLNSISGPVGGVEMYIENTDKLLTERGNSVLTVTLTGGESVQKNQYNVEIKITSKQIRRVFQDISPQENLLKELENLYDRFKPDLIHLHHYRIAFSTIYKFINSKNVPVVFTAHDALVVCPLSTLVKPGSIICEGGVGIRCGFTGCKIHSHLPYEIMLEKSFRKLSEMKIKALICPSYSVMNYLISNGYNPAVHLPSYSFFDESIVRVEPNYVKILSQKNIGYIGRLEWYKGVDDLIRGFSIFSSKHPDYNLLIAGTGPFESNLKKLSSMLGIDKKIEWLGKINTEQREEFYKNIVCNVVASKYWENFALSAQESLLRAVPTIGTEIGGIPEIVQNGRTGYLVRISSPYEIASKLEQIIANKEDSTVKMMKIGREFILKNLNPEKHMGGLMNIYEKVLSGVKIENGYDTNKIK
ncbi:MAG: glycosyltransferase family 4 protein [Thermoplasmataceae archaeon]